MSLYDSYFNKSLRDYLKYPEIFSISVSRDRITLTPNQLSKLLELIYKSNSIKNNIINSLKSGLRDPDLEDAYLSTNGSNIVINYVFKKHPDYTPEWSFSLGPFTLEPLSNTSAVHRFDTKTVNIQIINLDVALWATLFSYLGKREFYQLARSDFGFTYVLNNPTFWIELIRQKYPQYYSLKAKGYAWRELYESLVIFDDFYQEVLSEDLNRNTQGTYKRRLSPPIKYLTPTYEILYRLFSDHPELKRYLIMNDFLKLDKQKIHRLLDSTVLDLNLLKHLFEKYPPDKETLEFVDYVYTRNNRYYPDITNYLLNYKRLDPDGKVVKISQEYLNRRLGDQGSLRL